MWSMILLMSRLPGGHSMSAGRRQEKLGYQQSTLCWYSAAYLARVFCIYYFFLQYNRYLICGEN